jgi:hypothetical protein
MDDSTLKQTGIALALMDRLEQQRLPFIKALKEKVDKGEILNDFDIGFLNQVMSESNDVRAIISGNQDGMNVYEAVLSLYEDVIAKGMENQLAINKGQIE